MSDQRDQQPLQGPDEDELHELDQVDDGQTPLIQRRWWRWLGIVVAVLVVLSLTLPVVVPLLGSGNDAPPNGEEPLTAPDFTLPAASGEDLRLSDVLNENAAVVIVFYRGFF